MFKLNTNFSVDFFSCVFCICLSLCFLYWCIFVFLHICVFTWHWLDVQTQHKFVRVNFFSCILIYLRTFFVFCILNPVIVFVFVILIIVFFLFPTVNRGNSLAHLIFIIHLTLPQIAAWFFFTEKCRNLRQNCLATKWSKSPLQSKNVHDFQVKMHLCVNGGDYWWQMLGMLLLYYLSLYGFLNLCICAFCNCQSCQLLGNICIFASLSVACVFAFSEPGHSWSWETYVKWVQPLMVRACQSSSDSQIVSSKLKALSR